MLKKERLDDGVECGRAETWSEATDAVLTWWR